MPDKDPSAKDIRQARGTSGQLPDSGLARDLSQLARQLRAELNMPAVLRRIVETALAEIDAADWAGISVFENKRVHTEAASDEIVNRIDDLQYRFEQGPCLTSLHEQETVRSADLAAEHRWPRFAAAAAAEYGVRSMLSVQLFTDGDNLGALNLYAREPGRFGQRDENVAMLLAAHAAVAMKGSQVETNLRTALISRDLIGQAKGVLMERYKINPAQAFDMLVMASQQSHRKLRDVADELTTTGELTIDFPPKRGGSSRAR